MSRFHHRTPNSGVVGALAVIATLLTACPPEEPPDPGSDPASEQESVATPSTFTFGVWFEEGCDEGAMHTTFTINTACPCYLVSYVSPSGETKTNAHYDFSCTNEGVTFVQLTGTDACESDPLPAGSLRIDADLSTVCEAVQTSNGLTYQKLIDYEPCTPSEGEIPSVVPAECHLSP